MNSVPKLTADAVQNFGQWVGSNHKDWGAISYLKTPTGWEVRSEGQNKPVGELQFTNNEWKFQGAKGPNGAAPAPVSLTSPGPIQPSSPIAASPAPAAATTPAPAAEGTQPSLDPLKDILKKGGSQKQTIRDIQKLLKAGDKDLVLKGANGGEDGIMGETTRDALAAHIKKAGGDQALVDSVSNLDVSHDNSRTQNFNAVTELNNGFGIEGPKEPDPAAPMQGRAGPYNGHRHDHRHRIHHPAGHLPKKRPGSAPAPGQH